MPNNLSAYSFDNPINLCDLGACFNVTSGALTTGTLDPQTGQTRDGGYSPPPISFIYTPQNFDGTDSISLDSYLSEGSTVSVNLSTLSTCVNIATGYDMFNFGYELLIRGKGQILSRSDSYNYRNTFNIVCSSSFVTNWRILSGAATYNKMLSSSPVDRLPVGAYKRTTSPNDIIIVDYYLPSEYQAPPVFWPGELLNVYETKKIVWDSSSIRLGGEDLKNTSIPLDVNETTYVVDLPRDLSLYTINDYISTRTDVTLSGVQIGNTIKGYQVYTGGDPLYNEYFGESVDTSDDGTRIVVGDPSYRSGRFFQSEGLARAYQLINSNWIQLGQDLLGESIYDDFGWSVSMNSDGSRIAVGLPNTNFGGVSSGKGATKIYELSGSQWVQIGQSIVGESINDNSGYSIQLNSIGNRIVIADRRAEVDGVNGQVKVLEYDGSLWVQMGQTIPGIDDRPFSDGPWIDKVVINSIGDVIAFLSMTGGENGVVRVLKWDGVQWNTLVDNLVDIIAEEIEILNFINVGLSLNASGDTIAFNHVGGDMIYGYDSKVFILKYDGISWSKLGNTIEKENTGATYGDELSLNADGGRIVISDSRSPDFTYYSIGEVYVYEYNGTYWEKIIFDIEGPMDDPWKPASGRGSSRFGASIALNKLGDKLTVGATGLSGGQVFNYELPPYPIVGLSSYNAYKSVMLWSDGYITENPFENPFTIPDGTYNDSAGVINFRRFTSSGEYTILSNTFYYRNAIGKEIILTEPYNITFVVS